MRIKNKLFPYPTIQAGNNIYKTAKFDTSITHRIEGSKCNLLFEAQINVPEIRELIKNGCAAFAFHLECARTYFRRMVTFSAEKHGVTVDSSQLDRTLEICPMIVATQNIKNFVCTDLNDIYNGEYIDFSKGDIIAVGNQQILTIVKDKDALKKLSSIFYVEAYPDGFTSKHMTLEFEDKQIGILIPQNDAARFSQCKDDPKRKNTLFSAFYFPALIGVIDLMKSPDGDTHTSDLWYIHLSSKGKEKGIGEVESWQNMSSFEIAQILFDYPVTRYLKELAAASDEEALS